MLPLSSAYCALRGKNNFILPPGLATATTQDIYDFQVKHNPDAIEAAVLAKGGKTKAKPLTMHIKVIIFRLKVSKSTTPPS